jgi:thermostable 8-oxoguanine DNA glycosylase
MEILWKISEKDIDIVSNFYRKHMNNNFVKYRIENNIKGSIQNFSKINFWKTMVACLLTTQQRSGPKSYVTKFISTEPFPLDYDICSNNSDLQNLVEKTITNFGGLRRSKIIGQEISINYKWINKNGWIEINKMLDELPVNNTIKNERDFAKFIMDNLKGFGPKQSRNLLQSLGITKYEIPIDSRIVRWLNNFGFPIKLSATALSDENYYNFIMDGFQQLCRESDIYPCVLDAVIFSSYDQEEWLKDQLIL